jgi:2-amino-4-hydroxy-6-hydroxymethyldihydropteridine diphosphokinase
VAASPPPAGRATDRPPAGTERVAVALGGNLGDRRATLAAAVEALSDLLEGLRVSTFHDTTPVGVTGPQPRYLNAAVTGTTRLSARQLLDRLLNVERRFGRERPFSNAPRTLDLDLILYGSLVTAEEGIEIPHPRFRHRAFVLDPLDEIAADMIDPVTGCTVRQLRDRLRAEPVPGDARGGG